MVRFSREGRRTFVSACFQLFFLRIVLIPARPTQMLLFRMAKPESKSRIESDVATTVVVIWIAIGFWYGPLINSLCFFIVKLPIQHIFSKSFPSSSWLVSKSVQENKNLFWRLWKCFCGCPLWLLVMAWTCRLQSPEFLLKWFDVFHRSFWPCGGANFQRSFTAMVLDLPSNTVWSNFGR